MLRRFHLLNISQTSLPLILSIILPYQSIKLTSDIPSSPNNHRYEYLRSDNNNGNEDDDDYQQDAQKNSLRNRSFYFNRAEQESQKMPAFASTSSAAIKPVPREEDIAIRNFQQQQRAQREFSSQSKSSGFRKMHMNSSRIPFDIMDNNQNDRYQRGGGRNQLHYRKNPNNNNSKKPRLVGEDFEEEEADSQQTNTIRFQNNSKNRPTLQDIEGPSLAKIGEKIGGAEGQFISRKKREGDFVAKVNQNVDDLWYTSKRHLQTQDKLVKKLGSVEEAVRETLQPSTISLREEIRRRPIDKSILDEIHREQHGMKNERHLRKGLYYEKWIAKSDFNRSILEGSERARALFGFGGKIDLVATAREASQFPQSAAPEIAFIGSTNSGRSSLLNSVLNTFVCKHGMLPGTTTSANFYSVADGRAMIVDLPGFGYYHPIQTPKATAEASVVCLKQYMNLCSTATSHKPRNVKRVFLCCSGIALSTADVAYMQFMERNKIPFAVILTKTDMTPVMSLARKAEFIRSQLAPFTMCHELMMTSSLRLAGISKLQNVLSELVRVTESKKGNQVKFDTTTTTNAIGNSDDDEEDEDGGFDLDMSAIV